MVFLAVGGNTPGTHGPVSATFGRIEDLLARHGIRVLRASRLYRSAPIGPGLQPAYLNAVLEIDSPYPPHVLLGHLKAIERQAGRRSGRAWGPRPLDLDVIDFKRRVIGWPGSSGRSEGRLVLPHPQAHRRAFVLAPLSDIDPHWRHPGLGLSAKALLKRLKARPGDLVPVVDFERGPWQR
jgi:2-amino-4-hydroxy-6-hydroxymethyldihydropteridine diphosphokinase